MKKSNYLKPVRDQYEAYPYPPRNPEEERTRLLNSLFDFLEMINFFCFKGRNNFSANFRVLVAGGGTGDSTIFLAEQLRHNPRAEVVHLDISAKSMEIAKRRAQARNLTNITWAHNSLLALPSLKLGQFDYINCIGVLHHLKNPSEGLRALKSVLKDNGALMLMLYGKYGRTGIYQVQELMRKVNASAEDLQSKIENTKAILACLPKTNWFKRGEDLIDEHVKFGDAAIVDMFLHNQDQAYSVEEVYEFVERCGLGIIEFLHVGRAKYLPQSYIKDSSLLEKLQQFSQREQQAIAELISGSLACHYFYASKTGRRAASVEDLNNVPFFFLWSCEGLPEWMEKREGQASDIVNPSGVTISFIPNKYAVSIFKHLDGERCLKEIFNLVRNDMGRSERQLTDKELLKEFRPVYELFNSVSLILLRHKSVGKFCSIEEMQRRLEHIH